MTARYVVVATMDEGQIEMTASSADEVLDLRDEFLRDRACHELALYRLVCVEPSHQTRAARSATRGRSGRARRQELQRAAG